MLAGVLHALGLLPRGNYNLVPYVLRLFKSIRGTGERENVNAKTWYWKLCNDFRSAFARVHPESGDSRRFRVHFMGVWDTVSSVGWIWNQAKYPFTRKNPSVANIRHAIALDERRAFFRQNRFEKTGRQDLREMWFPGVHADVGGGYPEVDGDFGLWRIAFEWMVAEAKCRGLHFNDRRLQVVLNQSLPSPQPWADQGHESLTPRWWLAEFLPKIPRGRWLPRINFFRSRAINKGALIHESTLWRLRQADLAYVPANMSEKFVQHVRALPVVPPELAYDPEGGKET
jgi:uncharacterized protein (DUF2235 family)